MSRYSTEIVRQIWDDKRGDRIEVGPDLDALNLVEVRVFDVEGEVERRLTMTADQARLVAVAILGCADEVEREIARLEAARQKALAENPIRVFDAPVPGGLLSPIDQRTDAIRGG